jgi:hypothetical protein
MLFNRIFRPSRADSSAAFPRARSAHPGLWAGALSGRFDNDPVSDEQIGNAPVTGAAPVRKTLLETAER